MMMHDDTFYIALCALIWIQMVGETNELHPVQQYFKLKNFSYIFLRTPCKQYNIPCAPTGTYIVKYWPEDGLKRPKHVAILGYQWLYAMGVFRRNKTILY
jgi:hypothetical protein